MKPPRSKAGAAASAAQLLVRPGTVPTAVRIIGGQYKRTPIPVANKSGLRPTPARVRETLFDWLGHDLSGWRCMDVFAGTGALGFEAASRGAAQVLMVEQDAALVFKLKAVQAKLQATMVQIERSDGLSSLQRQIPGSLHLVLLDPPFDEALFGLPQRQALLRAAVQAIAAQGYAYLESPTQWPDAALLDCGWLLHRYLKAGAVHAHLLKQCPADAV